MKNTIIIKSNKRTVEGKKLVFILVTLMLILVSSFFICATVQSQTMGDRCEDEAYYQVLEKAYVKEIRAYLDEQGFENSGVNLTRVLDAHGNREYHITLHHKYLEKLCYAERERLFVEIEKMAFQADGCIFQINLLI